MAKITTTLGDKIESELGMILPHEHIFVDLRTWNTPGYAQAEPEDVVRLMGPEVARAKESGVSAIVECSTIGVGRRADLDLAVSAAIEMPFIVPTGFYREPWIPDWVHQATETKLTDLMLRELSDEIDGSGVQAGWIKLSAGDDGLTDCEKKVLRAAAVASRKTNSVIGSHTVRGSVVNEQLEILEAAGVAPERFVWIHTQAEPDFNLQCEMGKRGIWLEYDWIGLPDFKDDQYYLENIQKLLEAGLGNQLLLSQDRGWYDPAISGGGVPKPFTYLSDIFLPKLSEAGVEDEMIKQFTETNPFQAFAR